MPELNPTIREGEPFFVPDRLALTVTAILLSAAAVSWAVTYYLMPAMMMSSATGLYSIVTSLSLSNVGFFELVWVVGMAAMMFPAMIPVVAFYDRIVAKAEAAPTKARVFGTPLFLFGYLVAYAGLGLLAYLAVFAGLYWLSGVSLLWSIGFFVPSLILIVAGLYQVSSLKVRMLSVCISPFGFFATRLRRGLAGSLSMGFSHGIYCVTCCWAYMLVMLAVAWMSLPFMAIVAGVITLEKVIVRGSKLFNRGVAVAFWVLAAVVLFYPGLLTFQ
jgi:predicted metal-binding membrane protein